MTIFETNFIDVLFDFWVLVHVPCANMKEARFMISTAASHQVVIETLWLPVLPLKHQGEWWHSSTPHFYHPFSLSLSHISRQVLCQHKKLNLCHHKKQSLQLNMYHRGWAAAAKSHQHHKACEGRLRQSFASRRQTFSRIKIDDVTCREEPGRDGSVLLQRNPP